MANTIESLPGVGGGYEFASGGKSYSLSPIGPGIRKAIAQWARGRARERLNDDRETMTAAKFEWERQGLRTAINSGAYDWGTPFEEDAIGKELSAMLSETEGNLELVRLLLKEKHGDLPVKQVYEICQAGGMDYVDAFREALNLFPNWRTPKQREAATGMSKRDQWELFRALKANGALDEAPDSPTPISLPSSAANPSAGSLLPSTVH